MTRASSRPDLTVSEDRASHTPGPWRLELPPMPFDTIVPDIIGFNDWCVAEHVENKADARLIAAAPELLAALKTLVEGRPTQEPPKLATVAHRNWEIFEQARAAIAKAEGRS